jgi:L-threonylcarbamoyladenylate synthase
MIALGCDPAEARLFFDGSSRNAWAAAQNPAALPGPGDRRVRVLSESGDITEAAAGLFETLHDLDSLGLSRIRVEEVPNRGLGPAINDRYYRAQAR